MENQTEQTEDKGSESEGSDSSQTETEALSMGWVPKDQFRGDPSRWTDAETFVKRGHEMLPIVKAQNRQLREQVGTLSTQVSQTSQQLAAATEAIEALKEFNTSVTREKVKAQKVELKQALRKAKEDGDASQEVEIEEQLAELDASLSEASAKPDDKGRPPVRQPTPPHETPEYSAWAAANPWFGTDEARSDLAMGIASRLRASNPGLIGKAFFDKVTEGVEAAFGGARSRQQKVGDANGAGAGGNGSRSSSGKSYDDLPSDVKEVCKRQGTRLIGKGKAFKDEASWNAHYAKKYFE